MRFLSKNKPCSLCKIGKYSLFLLCFSGVTGSISADKLHVLKKGETLFSISKKYSTPLSVIMERNNITDAGKIIAGQKIYIPTTHTVQKGDTLYGIAKKYDVSLTELLTSNKIKKQHILKTGQQLIIPPRENSTKAASLPKNQTLSIQDPRSYGKKKINKKILWPVRAESISYLSGKLYGVVINSYKDEAVRSISSGRVISKGLHRGYGTVVFIQSKTKHVYVYAGLKETTIHAGQNISLGQKLGVLSNDSLTGKPRLYFMVYKNNKPLDPTKAPRGY